MDFLDSNVFEQMAREYNKKYSPRTVGVLSSCNDVLLAGTREVFCKILKLFECLERTFKRYNQFSNFFKNTVLLKNNIIQFFKENFNEDLIINNENKNTVNHKFCAISMLDTYIEIFKLNMDALNEINKLKNCLIVADKDDGNNNHNRSSYEKLEYLISKLCELQELLKTFTENLQEFYREVN